MKNNIRKYIGLYAFFIIIGVYTLGSIIEEQNELVKVKLILVKEGELKLQYSGESIVEKNMNYGDVEKYPYIARFNCDVDRQTVFKGDKVELTFLGIRESKLMGEVIKLEYDVMSSEIIIGFKYEGDILGESIAFQLDKNPQGVFNIVPLSVIYEDQEGKYVYIVKREQGAWGDNYVAYKQPIWIIAADELNASIGDLTNLINQNPVIVESEVEPYEGMKVKFY